MVSDAPKDIVEAMLAKGMEPAAIVRLARCSMHQGSLSERRFAQIVRLVGWQA